MAPIASRLSAPVLPRIVVFSFWATACGASLSHQRDGTATSRTPDHARPTGRAGANRRLVFATITLMIGLPAVLASFLPSADEIDMLLPDRPCSVGVCAVAVSSPSQSAGCMTTLLPAIPRILPDGRRPAASPSGSAGHPRTWPAIPPNGATLWDRLRGSSSRDRRVFLLSVAIQLHAPEAAVSPGQQRILPSKEG